MRNAQRRHRQDRRHGEEVSQTPPLAHFLHHPPDLFSSSSVESSQQSYPFLSQASDYQLIEHTPAATRYTEVDFDELQFDDTRNIMRDPEFDISMPTPDPPMDFSSPTFVDDPAITPADQLLIAKFHARLQADNMEECDICLERWFQRQVKDGVCAMCRKDELKHGVQVDRSEDSDFVPLFGPSNNMDPGPLPDLPQLTTVEEMLISPVHVFMEVRQHRGAQYKYTGHVCHFMCNVGKIYNRLPLLPQELDIVVLKPPRVPTDDAARVDRQFQKDCRVRRAAFKLGWTIFLNITLVMRAFR